MVAAGVGAFLDEDEGDPHDRSVEEAYEQLLPDLVDVENDGTSGNADSNGMPQLAEDDDSDAGDEHSAALASNSDGFSGRFDDAEGHKKSARLALKNRLRARIYELRVLRAYNLSVSAALTKSLCILMIA